MSGEIDLTKLLRNMTPILHQPEYGYGLIANRSAIPSSLQWFAMMHEDTAITVVATTAELETHKIEHIPGWARISLNVHSSLSGVGLTAAISKTLTDAGISANVVAGYYHDHFFVQWQRRGDAIKLLQALTKLH